MTQSFENSLGSHNTVPHIVGTPMSPIGGGLRDVRKGPMVFLLGVERLSLL